VKIDVHHYDIEGPLLVIPKRFGDARGFLSETYNGEDFAKAGITETFVQDNHSLTAERGTVRGLHFQAPPRAQDKLVRVTRGSMLDVIVDIRRGSPTYGRHLSAELNADNWYQLFIPKGFAHGFCTLTPDTEVLYKTSDFWTPEAEGGIRWNDPDLKIVWPEFAGSNLSAKDREQPLWAAFESPFGR
jgi:dTDP-4-dehydrorhamnose 3,5-epimerase